MAERGRGYYGDIPPDDEFFTDDPDLDHRDLNQFDAFLDTLIPVTEREIPKDQAEVNKFKKGQAACKGSPKEINWGDEGKWIDDNYIDDDDDNGGLLVKEPIKRK
jgi:hypothetical protein